MHHNIVADSEAEDGIVLEVLDIDIVFEAVGVPAFAFAEEVLAAAMTAVERMVVAP